MGILASPMSYLLTWIYDFIGNYGLALLVFTIIDKRRHVSFICQADKDYDEYVQDAAEDQGDTAEVCQR